MPHFKYRAVSPAGQVSEGDMDAANSSEVIARIQSLGHIPLETTEAGGSRLHKLLTADLFQSGRASSKSLAPLIRQLGILLRAGLPLDRALEILHEVTGRRAEADVPRRLLNRVRGGSALADAMADEPLFPEFCISMVRAGELSGALEVVLDKLADFLVKSEISKAKIKSALFYPAIVLGACVLSLVVLFAFVVPRFRPFFEDTHVDLPFMTQALLVVGDFFEQYWWVPPGVFAVIALALLHVTRDPKLRVHWDGFMLKMPLIGSIVHKVEISHFCRVLGTLLKNGVPLPNGLKIASETIRNKVLRTAISGVNASVKEGKGLAEPLMQTGMMPPLALRLVRVGEEAARLDDMLLEVATIYDYETEQSVERMLGMLGPALTVGLGLLVALVIGSIMMAVLSVYQLAN
jgi:general secretion pathway protein F